jgi:hypothetical protein
LTESASRAGAIGVRQPVGVFVHERIDGEESRESATLVGVHEEILVEVERAGFGMGESAVGMW